MTQPLSAIEPAHFDFDVDRDVVWKLPEPRTWDSAIPKSWWERVKEFFAAVDDAIVPDIDCEAKAQ